ncbi:HNH endonuclease signature motif containing protein [Amycolatopsis minnesotensis]
MEPHHRRTHDRPARRPRPGKLPAAERHAEVPPRHPPDLQHARGCTRPAQYTDLDHATAWKDGGRTDKANMRPLCRVHHVLRDEPGWTFTTDSETGVLTVTAPNGRSYTDEPTIAGFR